MITPFYEAEGITLYHGDSAQIVPTLSQRFDAVIADPPYNETDLEWDIWPKDWPSWITHLTDSLWCFGSFRMFWERAAEFADWKLSQDLVWEKHNGSSLHADRFKRVHEQAIHLYRGKWEALFKSPVMVPFENERKFSRIARGADLQHFRDVGIGPKYEYNGERLMRSVIPVRSCHGYAVNETQKPEGIIAPLMEYSVPPGGIVLDPFAGSGTTLAVARAQGKRAIGVEKREGQCRLIVQRLSQRVFVL